MRNRVCRVRYSVVVMLTISVIVPARNAAPYIEDAIRSALDQTVRPTEVIVVDDGSTDGTADIARAQGPLVTVISQRVDGPGAARNLAVAHSTGEWLAFLDADDIWMPNKLERQLARVGPETRLVFSDRYNIGELNGLALVHGDTQPPREGDIFVALMLHENFITTSSVLLRRDAFDEAGGFSNDPDLVVAEDWDLWMRITARHSVEVCHEPLVKYRLHHGGTSRQVDRMMRARTRVVSSALELPKGRVLSWLTKRRIWATTHRTNAGAAGRSGRPGEAYKNYVRSIATFPLQRGAYKGMLRLVLGLV